MTNELKEKIIECLTVHKEHGGGYFLLSNEKISELLAIIDEGIEEEVYKNMIENAGLILWKKFIG